MPESLPLYRSPELAVAIEALLTEGGEAAPRADAVFSLQPASEDVMHAPPLLSSA